MLNQRVLPNELWVVDDASNDGTQDWINENRKNFLLSNLSFFYHRFPKNFGVSKARNFALRRTQMNWVAFLDSDDEWLPDKLKLQREWIQKNPECSLLHGEEIWIRNGKRVNPKKKHQKGGGDQFFPSLALCVISPSTVIMQRDIFNKLGLFREDFPVCEDYELWLRVTANFTVGHIKTPLIVKYGGHPDQLSRKYFAMDYFRVKAILLLLQKFEKKLRNDQKKALCIEAVKKINILQIGHKKYHNKLKHEEMEKILLQVNEIHFISSADS